MYSFLIFSIYICIFLWIYILLYNYINNFFNLGFKIEYTEEEYLKFFIISITPIVNMIMLSVAIAEDIQAYSEHKRNSK